MKKERIFSIFAIVCLWLGWIVAYFCVGNDYLLPSVGDTFSALFDLFSNGAFWTAFGWTFLRTAEAFVVSLVLGVALAVAARLFSAVRAFLAPLISVLRTVPTLAVVLLLLLWTSPSVAPVLVAGMVLFPAVYAAALSCLDETEETYGILPRAFGVSRTRRIFWLDLPLSAPPLLAQTGAFLSLGLKITVSGEVLSATYRSIGGLMQEAKIFVEMPRLMALTIVTLAVGFLLEGVAYLLSRRILGWRS